LSIIVAVFLFFRLRGAEERPAAAASASAEWGWGRELKGDVVGISSPNSTDDNDG
jgi:hypothetical protein